MIWRRCLGAEDQNALLRLSRAPMAGKVELIWGFSKLQAPTDCDNFNAHAIECNGTVAGCALSWDWPEGKRYLSGLRFGDAMSARPRPAFWRTAFESLLENVSFAWTSIGQQNERARRMLESGVKGLPRYQPRQSITTWFVPLNVKRADATSSRRLDEELGLEAADWRHVAIASGKGWAYRAGRLWDIFGLPGIPEPKRPIRVAYYHPSPQQDIRAMRTVWWEAKGYDGIVVVLPDSSNRARRWTAAAPRMSWKWRSTLYTVSWRHDLPAPEVPPWKGLWL